MASDFPKIRAQLVPITTFAVKGAAPALADFVWGIGLRDRDARVTVERRVVVDIARRSQQAAMTVVGVLVEAIIGHEHERIADFVAQVA